MTAHGGASMTAYGSGAPNRGRTTFLKGWAAALTGCGAFPIIAGLTAGIGFDVRGEDNRYDTCIDEGAPSSFAGRSGATPLQRQMRPFEFEDAGAK